MKKMSLQWRLTCIITLYIAVICGCVTMLVYKNGVYYMDSLQEAVDTRGDDQPDDAEEIYISIPEDKWDEFANDFSVQVYNNKADYRKNSLIISAVLALLGGVATYFISGHALRPIRELSDKIEKVQAQNLADSRIEENQVKELNQLSVSYNRMLERLSDAFEIQRQFTANAAHELRTPLALMQVQLATYWAYSHKTWQFFINSSLCPALMFNIVTFSSSAGSCVGFSKASDRRNSVRSGTFRSVPL